MILHKLERRKRSAQPTYTYGHHQRALAVSVRTQPYVSTGFMTGKLCGEESLVRATAIESHKQLHV